MNILITGAGGFIGQALAKALSTTPEIKSLTLTDVVEPPSPPAGPSSANITITTLAANLTSPETCRAILTQEFTHIYLLHGIMSGASEKNLPLGLTVNIDSMRNILNVLLEKHDQTQNSYQSRGKGPSKPPRIIYPSSLAVFGGGTTTEVLGSPTPVTEHTATHPQSSYGAQKLICEALFNDFSRRGVIDACIVRLPTIIVRPGKPSGAASSFCSGIVREPLHGEQSVLPVLREMKLWVCSTRTIIRNLVLAKDVGFVDGHGDGDYSRVVNLPGVTVTVQQILDGLRGVGGEEAMRLVVEERDGEVERIVGSWPAVFDTGKALAMGFYPDGDLEETIRAYIEDYGQGQGPGQR